MTQTLAEGYGIVKLNGEEIARVPGMVVTTVQGTNVGLDLIIHPEKRPYEVTSPGNGALQGFISTGEYLSKLIGPTLEMSESVPVVYGDTVNFKFPMPCHLTNEIKFELAMRGFLSQEDLKCLNNQ